MKALFAAILLILTTTSASAKTDLDNQALALLMNKNPSVKLGVDVKKEYKVASLVAQLMTSSFEKNGEGSLSVVTNSCDRVFNGDFLDCTLKIQSSDRVLNNEGAYVPAVNMTESSLVIKYRVDATARKLVGRIEAGLAG